MAYKSIKHLHFARSQKSPGEGLGGLLIHLLGGLTQEDLFERDKRSIRIGTLSAFQDMKTFAEMMHGTPADEWSRMMYDHICGTIKRLEQTAD